MPSEVSGCSPLLQGIPCRPLYSRAGVHRVPVCKCSRLCSLKDSHPGLELYAFPFIIALAHIFSPHFLFLVYSLEGADFDACSALDALVLVDDMRCFTVPAMAFTGRPLCTLCSRRIGRIDLNGNKRLACSCRASLLPYVRLIFIPEVAQGRKHRVGSCLAQAAEEAVLICVPR